MYYVTRHCQIGCAWGKTTAQVGLGKFDWILKSPQWLHILTSCSELLTPFRMTDSEWSPFDCASEHEKPTPC